MKLWTRALALLMVTACGSFEEDMKMICDAEKGAEAVIGDTSKIDPSQFFTIYAAYIGENAKTDEGKALLASITKKGQAIEDRIKLVEEASKKAGLNDCAFVGVLRRHGELSAFRDEVKAMCDSPQGELAKRLAEIPDSQKQVQAREAYFDANLKTEKGQKLWAVLRDASKSVEERARAAKEAVEEASLVNSKCEHLEAVKRADAEKGSE